MKRTTWIINGGLLTLAALLLPDAILADISARLPHPLEDPLSLTILLTLPVAIVAAALLLYSALTLRQAWQEAGSKEERASQARRTRIASVAALALSALVLAKIVHSLYWFMVWDATGDSLGNAWLVLPLLVVFFSGALLFTVLRGKAQLAGFSYLLLIPALMVTAERAQRVDFRQLTAARAERVRQAIETYYTREGHYPQNLRQLTPWYAVSLPDPVVIYGQSWCYQGGQDYYRLGYLDREHWSSPILFGRVYSAKGRSPLRADVCQPAIDAYRARHPDWDRVLQDYGRPTPTPDIGASADHETLLS